MLNEFKKKIGSEFTSMKVYMSKKELFSLVYWLECMQSVSTNSINNWDDVCRFVDLITGGYMSQVFELKSKLQEEYEHQDIEKYPLVACYFEWKVEDFHHRQAQA